MSKASWRQKSASAGSGMVSNLSQRFHPLAPGGREGGAPGVTRVQGADIGRYVISLSHSTTPYLIAGLEVYLTHDFLRSGSALDNLGDTALLQRVHPFTHRRGFDLLFTRPGRDQMPHGLTHA